LYPGALPEPPALGASVRDGELKAGEQLFESSLIAAWMPMAALQRVLVEIFQDCGLGS